MFLTFINFFIAAWGIFFFVLILTMPHDRPLAKAMLLVFIVTQTITPLGATFAQVDGVPPELIGYTYNLFYLSGPAFYFYIKALRQPTFSLGCSSLWHLSPAIFIPLLFYGLLFHFDESWPISKLHLLTMQAWFLVYLIAALRLLPGYKWFLQELFEPKESVIWRWLYIPTIYYTAAYLVRTLYLASDLMFSLPQLEANVAYVMAMFARVIFFYLVAIGSYRNKHVYELQEDKPKDQEQEELLDLGKSKLKKYQKSALSDGQIKVLWVGLNDYMSVNEAFLNNDLKLSQLADALGISSNDLSRVINSQSNQTFYDFINGYRAHKAKMLIAEHANSDKSMLDMSLESGFGNSATFYKYFKKHFSVTPAKFRKTCKNNQNFSKAL